ncbi:MAG: DUF2982 domain-containing protein, partial [Plesiomonas sp.]
LLNRMRHCRRLLGYDLYIPSTALDRPAQEVITLSRGYRDHAERSAAHQDTGEPPFTSTEPTLSLQRQHTK